MSEKEFGSGYFGEWIEDELGLPNLNAIAWGEDVTEHSLLIDPGPIGAVTVVQDILALLQRDHCVMARDRKLTCQDNIVVGQAADR